MPIPAILIILLAYICLSSLLTKYCMQSFQIEIQFGSRKCMTHTPTSSNSTIRARFKAIPPPLPQFNYQNHGQHTGNISKPTSEMPVDLFVVELPHGAVLAHRSSIEDFTLTLHDVSTSSTIRFCLWHQLTASEAALSTPSSRRVSFSLHETYAFTAEESVNVKQVDDFNSKINELKNEVNTLIFKIDEMQKRDLRMMDIHKQTNHTLIINAILSCSVIIGMAIFNVRGIFRIIKKQRTFDISSFISLFINDGCTTSSKMA